MQEIGIDLGYFLIGGFFVEVLTEAIKKKFNLDGGNVLFVAIVLGILFAWITPNQTIAFQLKWNIPIGSSIFITGVVVSSFGKFYDYVFKVTRLKTRTSE